MPPVAVNVPLVVKDPVEAKDPLNTIVSTLAFKIVFPALPDNIVEPVT